MAYGQDEHEHEWLMTPHRAPRISGTAMPNGVFLSTGTASTAPALSLVLTGLTIISVGAASVVPTYVVAWLAEQALQLSIPAMLIGFAGPSDPLLEALVRIGLSLVSFLSFLVVLRLTPLAGYHAAEHMTVHAIEHWGVSEWEGHVREMPRAHPRCGSTLLSGILPTLMVAIPLYSVAPLLALMVSVVGWMTRQRVGYLIQRIFTTKPPTELQLKRGMDAGRLLLERWAAEPDRAMSTLQRLWVRGLPQMVVGVVIASTLLTELFNRLPGWLDW
jgi:hypothetical protein